LDKIEIGRLVAAPKKDENQIAAKAIQLMVLTGARRNEITRARWEQ
jgi:integrase